MLEDFLDPMRIVQRMQGQQPLQPWAQQNQNLDRNGNIKIDPLTPEAEQGLLPKIGGAALGGLGYVGSVLEKTFGGRAIRGALAGKPRELLSPLPFSDTLGITDEADRTSGRDLLRQWGAADKEDTWGNFAGGLGLELATDPGMYLTTPFGGGALTEAGQVAKKIGQLPGGVRNQLGGSLKNILSGAPAKVMADAEIAAGGAGKLAPLMDQSLTGLAGFKLPFSEFFGGGVTPLLTGRAGERVLDAASTVGSKIAGANEALSQLPYGAGFAYRNFTPPGMVGQAAPYVGKGLDAVRRYGKSLFDSSVMGAVTDAGQGAAKAGFDTIRDYAAPFKEKAAGYAEKLKELGATSTPELTRAIEGVAAHPNPQVQAVADAIRGNYQEMLAEAHRLGMDIAEFHDPLSPTLRYGPRHLSDIVENGGVAGFSGGSAGALAARDITIQGRRAPIYGGMKEGSDTLNQLIRDPAVFGDKTTRAARAAHIQANYLRDPALIEAEQLATGTGNQTAAEIAKLQTRQAKLLARRIESLPEEFQLAANGQLMDQAGKPIAMNLFGHNPVDELINYADNFARMRGQAVGAHKLIGDNLIDAATGAAVPKGALTAHEALKKAGLTLNAPGTTISGAHNTLLDAVNAQRAAAGMPPAADLAGIHLSSENAAELGRIMKGFDNPEALNPIVRGVDKLTQLFKSFVTAPWPGFNVRNYLSGQVQNLAKGATGTLQDSAQAYKMGMGGAWQGLEEIPAIRDALAAAGRPVNAEEATKQLARWQFAYGSSGHSPNIANDVISSTGNTIRQPRTLDDVLAQVTGTSPRGISDVAKAYVGGEGSLNPIRAFSKPEDFSPVVAGRHAGEIIENMNRSPLFVQRLREGYTPAEAAKEVLAAHYDYSKTSLTPFEKTVMRRLIPFYSYTRQNIPQVMEQLAANPGGLAGTLARVSHDTRESGFIPKYMGEGLAIPLTNEDPQTGMKRFLTRLDVPADQAFEFFKGTTGDPIQASVMGLLGQLNPIIKGPVEYAVDKQFYSGRELGDLYTMTGNPLVDQALFNSPLARVATTARQLTDPRKYEDWWSLPLNLLTGAKVTDVDMPKYQAIAEREYIKKQLQGLPATGKFETIYPKPDLVGTLTPEQFQLVQLQKLLEKRARQSQPQR